MTFWRKNIKKINEKYFSLLKNFEKIFLLVLVKNLLPLCIKRFTTKGRQTWSLSIKTLKNMNSLT